MDLASFAVVSDASIQTEKAQPAVLLGLGYEPPGVLGRFSVEVDRPRVLCMMPVQSRWQAPVMHISYQKVRRPADVSGCTPLTHVSSGT